MSLSRNKKKLCREIWMSETCWMCQILTFLPVLSCACDPPLPPSTQSFSSPPVKPLLSSSRRSPKKAPEVGEHYFKWHQHGSRSRVMTRVWNFSVPQHHPNTLPPRARKRGSTRVRKSLSSPATSSPRCPRQRTRCHLTPTARCASCQTTPSRGSGTSSWGRTASGRRPRASSPSWLVPFKEVVPNVTCSFVWS